MLDYLSSQPAPSHSEVMIEFLTYFINKKYPSQVIKDVLRDKVILSAIKGSLTGWHVFFRNDLLRECEKEIKNRLHHNMRVLKIQIRFIGWMLAQNKKSVEKLYAYPTAKSFIAACADKYKMTG